VAKLLFCHDEDCVYGPDLHLRVEFEDIELEKSSAIAISYTWGEFDREGEFIGHDTESNPLLDESAQLGQDNKLLFLLLASIDIGCRPGLDFTVHASMYGKVPFSPQGLLS
jgi:hypothetical protein